MNAASRVLLLLGSLAALSGMVSAQNQAPASAPLRELPLAAQSHSRRVIPVRPLPLRTPAQASAPAGDAALQSSSGPATPTTTGVNIEGLGMGYPGFSLDAAPPDPTGAVGRTQYVQMVNEAIVVLDKQGNKVAGPTPTNALFSALGSNPCATSNDGDGVVLYDHMADRWLISQFANVSNNSGPWYQCVAISQTSDAAGAYYLYYFTYSQFNDYPKFGIWPDAYYVSYNTFTSPVGAFVGAKLCALDRTNMLAGNTPRGGAAAPGSNQLCFDISDGGLLPADLDGATQPPAGRPGYFMGWYDGSHLGLWQLHVDWTTLTNSTLNVTHHWSSSGNTPFTCSGACLITLTSSFSPLCNGGVCIPQKGTSQQLDSLADRLMYRLAYRNFGDHESLVVNHAITTGLRWYEVRNPNGTPTVYQLGTYAPDSSYRWMGSMAMDQQGNMALGYSVSSSSLFPSIAYTTRAAGDTLGAMGAEVTLKAGTGSQTGGLSRWGDYSGMSVDPVDDCTFWYTNEYIPSNGSFNWHTRIGSFKVSTCAPQIANVSASPLGGTGNNQTFTFVYSDSVAAAELGTAQVIFNSGLTTIGGCALVYDNGNRTVTLYDDSGYNLLTPVTVGQAGTVSNSRCSVNAGASSATLSGNDLTLSLALSFTASFSGQQTAFMNVGDANGNAAGWKNMGTWNTGSGAFVPANVSASPLGGVGNSQTFTFVYSDTGGAAAITVAQAIVNGGLTTIGGCAVVYNNSNNTVTLYDDSGYNLPAGIPVGQPGTLSNSQCTVNAGSSSATPSGNNLTLSLALAFTSGFAGQKAVYMNVTDSGGLSAGWQNMGTWNTGSGSTVPTNVSVTPSSGSGSSQTFSLVYSDTGGAGAITLAQAIVNSGLTTIAGCALVYNHANNTVALCDDSGYHLLAPVTVGQAGTLSNSQCTLNAGSSSATPSGNNLTVNLALSFTPAFLGQKAIYMNVSDSGGLSAGWQNKGSWNTGSGSTVPTNVSVTPNTGSGSSQSFSFVYSDTGGAGAITLTQAIFNTGLTTTGACAIVYDPANNSITIYADNGTTLLTPVTLGQAGTLSNSQCTLNAGTSSATPAGNNLTLNLALSFGSSFIGQKAIYMNVSDSGGLSAGWQNMGSWNTGSGSTVPANVSVTPNAGSGSSQTFSFVYSDSGGATLITTAQALVNSALTTIQGCSLIYDRAANTITMYDDGGYNLLAPIPLGAAGTLSNSQCTLNAGSSSAVPSGNNLTLNLALSFTPAFSGAKFLYMNVSDSGGLSAGWQNKGSWTVP